MATGLQLLKIPTTVVLTGGTSGIGYHLLERLLDGGHQVVVVARRASTLQPQARLIPINVDFADVAAVRAAGARLAAEHTDATMLINNAALQYPAQLIDPDFDPRQMEAEVAINLIAPTLLIHALLPSLRCHAERAAIINVSSGLAYFPKQQSALYCATKAALSNFTQSLRYQLEDDGILVSEVVLPLVDTPMTEGRGTGKISAAAAANAILTGIAHRRETIHVGKAKLLPILSRLAPGLGRHILRGS
jgi:uncharacterized oxidoreductase